MAPLAVDAGVATLGEAHVVAAPVAGVAEAVLALLGALAAGVVALGELRVAALALAVASKGALADRRAPLGACAVDGLALGAGSDTF